MLSARTASILCLPLTFFALAAHAGSSFQVTKTWGNRESYITMSVNDPSDLRDLMPKVSAFVAGDFSSLKAPTAEVHKTFPLGDMLNQDFIVDLRLPSKVVLLEDTNGPLDMALYASEGAPHEPSYQADAGHLVIQGPTGAKLCAMTTENGRVTGVLGECAVVTIAVPPGGRVRVLIDGKLKMRSKAVKISMADVLAEDSNSERVRTLDAYLARGGQLSGAQLAELVSGTSMDSDKVRVVRMAAPHVSGQITSAQVNAIVSSISMSSNKMAAMRELSGKAQLTEADLLRMVDEVSLGSDKVGVLREHASRVRVSGNGLARIVSEISMSSDKVQALRIVTPSVDVLSARDAASIIDDVSMSSNKLEALRIIVGKVPGDQIMALADSIQDDFMMSDQKEAMSILLRAKR